MDPLPDAQAEELEQLRGIYDKDFHQLQSNTAWRAAPSLPEIDIQLRHPDHDKVSIKLRAKLPKTYPERAAPIFNVHDANGLKPDQVKQLNEAIKAQIRQYSGSAMLFEISAFVQDWIFHNNNLPKQDSTPNISLAAQLQSRTAEAERNRALKEQQAHELAQREKDKKNAEFQDQVSAREAQMQQSLKENRGRRRGHSVSTDATGIDANEMVSFPKQIDANSIQFDTVRIACRRKEYLWTTHFAEPAHYSQQVDLPALELYTVAFDAQYYTTPAGRKKLRELEESLRKAIALPHKALLVYYAAHLQQGNRDSPAKLFILAEQRPPTTLHDLLRITGPLSHTKATELLVQIVSALNVLHAGDIIHRNVSAKCIHIEQDGANISTPNIKLARTSWYSRLVDLQHSNKFDATPPDEVQIPESWIAREVMHQPLHYTRNRDLWNVGIVLLQMLFGLDVTSRYSSFTDVLDRTDFPTALRNVATAMFEPSKKQPWSCMRVLEELRSTTFAPPTKTAPIAIPSPRSAAGRARSGTLPNSIPEVSTSPRAMINARRSELPPGRFMTDFQVLDRLGSGGFGEVVKAEHKIDKKIYAIKKIKLRRGADEANDNKIFREVNTLSRLNHRYIVRYYSAWIEDDDEPELESQSEESSMSRPSSSGFDQTMQFSSLGKSRGRSFPFNHASFSSMKGSIRSDEDGPNIVFGSDSTSESSDQEDDDGNRGGDEDEEEDEEGEGEDEDDEDEEEDEDESGEETIDEDDGADDDYLSLGLASPIAFRHFSQRAPKKLKRKVTPGRTQTLYISMEFVEKQTLKERVEEGLDEDEAWRLFNQILDALVHMSSLGIIHRDIKLTNIFIDGKGDVKVGDFGLATSSLAQVAPADLSNSAGMDPDVTRDVGTLLYVAPEVISRTKRSRNQSKADMYSLGICFFEMNYAFSTGYERIQVIENLRRPSIIFPSDWPTARVRQRKIIEALLKHDPERRLSPLELQHSELLPPRLADEFFNESMQIMTRPDSSHYLQVVQALFKQPYNPVKASSYNSMTDRTAFEQVTNVVIEHLRRIFTKHGAVEMDAPLLGPIDPISQQGNVAMFLDSSGDLVALPRNLLTPFARMSVRNGQQRIKRFCIGDTYHQVGIGHPQVHKLASFDILTPDAGDGQLAAVAEAIALVDECLSVFPAMSEAHCIDISHPDIEREIMQLFPEESRETVQTLLRRGPASEKFVVKKKRELQRLGLQRAEAIVALWHDRIKMEDFEHNLPEEPRSRTIQAAIEQVKKVMLFAKTLGVKQTIYFRTFMNRPSLYSGGLCFHITKGSKRSDEFAVGGRYDNLFEQVQPGRSLPGICAIGVQFSLQPLASAVEAHLNQEKRALEKKSRSALGSWAPRRADVYVISRQAGYTQERLDICALLWSHNIRADMMYDHAVLVDDSDDPLLSAQEDGIFFCIIVPPTLSASGRPEYKVKNLLTGEQHGLSRSEMPVWLLKEITKQRREDQKHLEPAYGTTEPTSHTLADSVEYIMPDEFYSEKKKYLKANSISLMKVEELDREIRSAVVAHTPMVAVDVDPLVFSTMTSSNWLKDEDAWKALLALFPKSRSKYAEHIRNKLRDLPGYRKEINEIVLLCSVRDLRVAILRIPVSARTI